jgi:hypothetical protein
MYPKRFSLCGHSAWRVSLLFFRLYIYIFIFFVFIEYNISSARLGGRVDYASVYDGVTRRVRGVCAYAEPAPPTVYTCASANNVQTLRSAHVCELWCVTYVCARPMHGVHVNDDDARALLLLLLLFLRSPGELVVPNEQVIVSARTPNDRVRRISAVFPDVTGLMRKHRAPFDSFLPVAILRLGNNCSTDANRIHRYRTPQSPFRLRDVFNVRVSSSPTVSPTRRYNLNVRPYTCNP